MAQSSHKDKRMVLYEYNPLINGINPPKDLSNMDQLLRSVEQTYFRSIHKIGFHTVLEIMNYLVDNDAFTTKDTAGKLVQGVKKGRIANSKGDAGNDKWYIPFELQQPLFTKVLEIVEDSAYQHIQEKSPYSIITPAEALDKLLLPAAIKNEDWVCLDLVNKEVKRKMKLSKKELKRKLKEIVFLPSQEVANRLLEVRQIVIDGSPCTVATLQKAFWSAWQFTTTLGETERPKYLKAISQRFQIFNQAVKSNKKPMNSLSRIPRGTRVPIEILQEVDDHLKRFLSTAAKDLKDDIVKIFSKHSVDIELPDNYQFEGNAATAKLGKKRNELQNQISSVTQFPQNNLGQENTRNTGFQIKEAEWENNEDFAYHQFQSYGPTNNQNPHYQTYNQGTVRERRYKPDVMQHPYQGYQPLQAYHDSSVGLPSFDNKEILGYRRIETATNHGYQEIAKNLGSQGHSQQPPPYEPESSGGTSDTSYRDKASAESQYDDEFIYQQPSYSQGYQPAQGYHQQYYAPGARRTQNNENDNEYHGYPQAETMSSYATGFQPRANSQHSHQMAGVANSRKRKSSEAGTKENTPIASKKNKIKMDDNVHDNQSITCLANDLSNFEQSIMGELHLTIMSGAGLR